MVLIHAGIHFNAILPWLAIIAMGINVISGMVGKMLLGRSREDVQALREHYQLRGLSRAGVEQAIFWEPVTFDAMPNAARSRQAFRAGPGSQREMRDLPRAQRLQPQYLLRLP